MRGTSYRPAKPTLKFPRRARGCRHPYHARRSLPPNFRSRGGRSSGRPFRQASYGLAAPISGPAPPASLAHRAVPQSGPPLRCLHAITTSHVFLPCGLAFPCWGVEISERFEITIALISIPFTIDLITHRTGMLRVSRTTRNSIPNLCRRRPLNHP